MHPTADGVATIMQRHAPLHYLCLTMAVLVLSGRGSQAQAPVEPAEGVALSIVMDTSGSMKDAVPDQRGGRSPKSQIANRALLAIVERLEAFAKPSESGPARALKCGLVAFRNGQAVERIPLGDFDAAGLRAWAGSTRPDGGTPLGGALELGAKQVLGSGLGRKHILVVTDGENTVGPDPVAVMPRLRARAAQAQTSIALHFVAFDVDAKVFKGVKDGGATVVSASDEAQLKTQLQYILERKILLEDEEPPAGSAPVKP